MVAAAVEVLEGEVLILCSFSSDNPQFYANLITY